METLGEYIHLRITTEQLDLDKLVDFLKNELDVICIVREFGKFNKEHIHSTIKLKTAKTTFLDRLKRTFPLIKGNGFISMKSVKNWDSNIRYCYKGTPNDYPDIYYTIHTEEEWKNFYQSWWNTNREVIKTKTKKTTTEEVNMGCQNDPSSNEVFIVKRQRVMTWSEKTAKAFLLDYRPLAQAIWFFHGDNNYEPINDLVWCQDEVASYLLKCLGQTAKAIDDFIFERMYTGLYTYILISCPTSNLYRKKAVERLGKFRDKLMP
ncbi:hypothetical protein [Pseudomonas sp.]|uniref:hypothetical protein n=1 Tax=Pseudomonas sp. TaxID=306 RepID=UPI0019A76CA7|nr:hypothetical protein [Pseudomonas sp.]MBC6626280.1 hypothetical protein [Pseudomonas sp.]